MEIKNYLKTIIITSLIATTSLSAKTNLEVLTENQVSIQAEIKEVMQNIKRNVKLKNGEEKTQNFKLLKEKKRKLYIEKNKILNDIRYINRTGEVAQITPQELKKIKVIKKQPVQVVKQEVVIEEISQEEEIRILKNAKSL